MFFHVDLSKRSATVSTKAIVWSLTSVSFSICCGSASADICVTHSLYFGATNAVRCTMHSWVLILIDSVGLDPWCWSVMSSLSNKKDANGISSYLVHLGHCNSILAKVRELSTRYTRIPKDCTTIDTCFTNILLYSRKKHAGTSPKNVLSECCFLQRSCIFSTASR